VSSGPNYALKYRNAWSSVADKLFATGELVKSQEFLSERAPIPRDDGDDGDP
jgi:hypothetical protein